MSFPSRPSRGQQQAVDQNVINQKADAFLSEYRSRNRQQFERLAKYTREDCERLLESMNIKGSVQGRAKQEKSLEKKLEDLKYDQEVPADAQAAPNFRVWVSGGNSIYDHPEMGDLAGVRIGLYFPDDIARVRTQIQERFRESWLFGSVPSGREVHKGDKWDFNRHMEGAWRSRGSDGTDVYWENPGYKSWQVVVQWRAALPDKALQPLKVEIQLGTVVTQAWAEIQHNIIYKSPPEIRTTETMRRMIDAINGLAISTDIMLKELAHTMVVARAEADRLAQAQLRTARDTVEDLQRFKAVMTRNHHETWLSRWHQADQELKLLEREYAEEPHPPPMPQALLAIVHLLKREAQFYYELPLSDRLELSDEHVYNLNSDLYM